jgi:hypothetical protein
MRPSFHRFCMHLLGLPSASGARAPGIWSSRGGVLPPRERSSTSGGRQGSVVVAMVAVRVMKVAADAIIYVVASPYTSIDHVLIDMAFVRWWR